MVGLAVWCCSPPPAEVTKGSGSNPTVSSDATAAVDQSGGPHAGEVPPAIQSATWLNTPDDKPLTWEGLKGHVVLIDLWAFW